MSTRLQVVLPEAEMAEIRKFARRQGVTVGEWVRRALRQARNERSPLDPQLKLKSLRQAVKHTYPSADIDQMLKEIEKGYES